MLWPPTTGTPASASLAAPPATMRSSSPLPSWSLGNATRPSANSGRAPIAYTSLRLFAAAMAPNASGWSTMGVKKSTVETSARSSAIRKTAASSPVVAPTRTLGSSRAGSAPRTCPSSTGLSLQAQPAPWLYWVSLSVVSTSPERTCLLTVKEKGERNVYRSRGLLRSPIGSGYERAVCFGHGDGVEQPSARARRLDQHQAGRAGHGRPGAPRADARDRPGGGHGLLRRAGAGRREGHPDQRRGTDDLPGADARRLGAGHPPRGQDDHRQPHGQAADAAVPPVDPLPVALGGLSPEGVRG